MFTEGACWWRSSRIATRAPQHLFEDFTRAFNDADQLLIADIYAAGEKPIPGVSARRSRRPSRSTGITPCATSPTSAEIVEDARGARRGPGDVVIALGAGDINKILVVVHAKLAERTDAGRRRHEQPSATARPFPHPTSRASSTARARSPDRSRRKNARGARQGATAGAMRPKRRPGFLRHRVVAGFKLAVGVASIVVGRRARWRGALTATRSPSPRFAIRDASRSAAPSARPTTQIAELAGVKLGQNLFAVDTNSVEQKLLTDPWIKEVKVTRTLPEHAAHRARRARSGRPRVRRRQPLPRHARRGEPFKQLEEGDPSDLPVVTGITLRRSGARSRARRRAHRARARDPAALGAHPDQPRASSRRGAPRCPAGDAVLTVGKAGITLQLGKGPWRKKMLMAERVMARSQRKGKVPGIVFADNSGAPRTRRREDAMSDRDRCPCKCRIRRKFGPWAAGVHGSVEPVSGRVRSGAPGSTRSPRA